MRIKSIPKCPKCFEKNGMRETKNVSFDSSIINTLCQIHLEQVNNKNVIKCKNCWDVASYQNLISGSFFCKGHIRVLISMGLHKKACIKIQE